MTKVWVEVQQDHLERLVKRSNPSFQMLKAAVEKSPNLIRRIVQEILDLPHEKRDEQIQLLDRTSLSSIISASSVVLNRLDFLAGLEVAIFDYEAKKKTKEI
jgi:hypothetical protein